LTIEIETLMNFPKQKCSNFAPKLKPTLSSNLSTDNRPDLNVSSSSEGSNVESSARKQVLSLQTIVLESNMKSGDVVQKFKLLIIWENGVILMRNL